MAVGKNPRANKARKGSKKKQVDPFTRKVWYNIKVPAIFAKRVCGKTPVNKTAGTKTESDGLRGRVFEVSLADLKDNAEEQGFRKMKLVCQEVQGQNALCNFYGMDFTRDKLASLLKKWCTLVESAADLKTADGYTIRMFCIGFTDKRSNQVSKTSYAQSSQVRALRKKMSDVMKDEVEKGELKDTMQKVITSSIGTRIQKEAESIYPLRDVFVRKIKILKSPKFDVTRLMELHEGAEEVGAPAAPAGEEEEAAALGTDGGRF